MAYVVDEVDGAQNVPGAVLAPVIHDDDSIHGLGSNSVQNRQDR
jgi:hypothetical protein